jgi:hypothetical protein
MLRDKGMRLHKATRARTTFRWQLETERFEYKSGGGCVAISKEEIILRAKVVVSSEGTINTTIILIHSRRFRAYFRKENHSTTNTRKFWSCLIDVPMNKSHYSRSTLHQSNDSVMAFQVLWWTMLCRGEGIDRVVGFQSTIFSLVLYLALDSSRYIHEILCFYATHHHNRAITANVI